MSTQNIDYSTYRLLDDVAHDHVVSDRLYDDFASWKQANGKSEARDVDEQLQGEFLAQYRPA